MNTIISILKVKINIVFLKTIIILTAEVTNSSDIVNKSNGAVVVDTVLRTKQGFLFDYSDINLHFNPFERYLDNDTLYEVWSRTSSQAPTDGKLLDMYMISKNYQAMSVTYKEGSPR